MLDQTQKLDQPRLIDQCDGDNASAIAVWWPVIGASMVIAIFSVAISVAQMRQTYPHDPWESIIIADAYRASVGLPVYTNPNTETGHATHIYGPLIIYTIGMLFRLTGINLMVAHLVPLIATIWVILAATVIYFRRLPWIPLIAGIAMLMSLNIRFHGLFTQIHPDMPAMGFSILALILMFHVMEKRRWAFLPLALASFCVAYLFKQNFAMFTIVPLLSLILGRKCSMGTLLAVAAPPVTIIALIIAIWLIAPWIHYHMIIVVSRWPMRFEVLVASPLRFLGFYSLLPLALSIMILIRPGIAFREPKMRWLISAGVGALPGSLLTYSKLGGGASAFMPALIPLIVLSTLGIAAAWQTTIANLISPARARMFASLIAIVMMVDAVEITREALSLFIDGHGDRHYSQVVEYVRNLKGRVICPDDPTIPIVALGQPGRSFWAESDTRVSSFITASFKSEILNSDFVVVVNCPIKTGWNSNDLLKFGFVPVSWGGADMGIYQLWRKRQPGESDATPHLD